MKKYRIILTKTGKIYFTDSYSHESLINSYKISGRDWHDWVRIVLDAEGNFQVKGNHEMPEWLERQYGYFKGLVKRRLEHEM